MPFKQALVFGASGISGWVLTRECLMYPTTDTFDRVIGLVNKPLDKSEFLVEKHSKRLDIYSGIDLSQSVDAVVKTFSEIPQIDSYGAHNEAYGGHSNPFGLLTEVNVGFLKAALAAVTAACPLMEFWTLQTGGKGYGFEVLGQPGLPYHPPHKESSLPLPEPYGSMIFYNGQHAELASQAVGKSWTFCEIIPDLIIGHAPRANLMCFAQVMGLLLLLYAEIEGKGSQAIFPGPEAVYNALHSDTSQDISARLAIFSALHPNATAGQRYNIADQDEGVSFATLWPEVCAYFGLKGLGPDETIGGPKGAAWVLEHKSQWNAFETKHGLKQGIFESIPWPLLQASTKLVVFDRHYDLSKARALGFQEARPAIEGYKIAFQRLRTAKIIPH